MGACHRAARRVGAGAGSESSPWQHAGGSAAYDVDIPVQSDGHSCGVFVCAFGVMVMRGASQSSSADLVPFNIRAGLVKLSELTADKLAHLRLVIASVLVSGFQEL